MTMICSFVRDSTFCMNKVEVEKNMHDIIHIIALEE